MAQLPATAFTRTAQRTTQHLSASLLGKLGDGFDVGGMHVVEVEIQNRQISKPKRHGSIETIQEPRTPSAELRALRPDGVQLCWAGDACREAQDGFLIINGK